MSSALQYFIFPIYDFVYAIERPTMIIDIIFVIPKYASFDELDLLHVRQKHFRWGFIWGQKNWTCHVHYELNAWMVEVRLSYDVN